MIRERPSTFEVRSQAFTKACSIVSVLGKWMRTAAQKELRRIKLLWTRKFSTTNVRGRRKDLRAPFHLGSSTCPGFGKRRTKTSKTGFTSPILWQPTRIVSFCGWGSMNWWNYGFPTSSSIPLMRMVSIITSFAWMNENIWGAMKTDSLMHSKSCKMKNACAHLHLKSWLYKYKSIPVRDLLFQGPLLSRENGSLDFH